MRLYRPEDGGRRAVEAMRWGAAGLAVVALHAVGGWFLVSHAFPAPADTVQGIPIDLEPVAVPQNAPEPNSAAAAGPAPAPQAAAAPEP
ncbi:hypothetical protein P7D22_23050, partial [Lichenihabitans sp. Uapishka_5]|nr:hypothetical protein [Lichenihabitans sp. Uapishka_5]